MAKVCDLLYTVGLRSKFYEEGAHENKMLKKHMRHFDNAWKAGQALQNVIEPGDIIYIKGSQSMRMEKAVEEIMLHPEKKEKLLVRQEREWLNR